MYNDTEHKLKSLGKNVNIGQCVYFRYPELSTIGDNVIIDEFCSFTCPVEIGDFVHIAPHVCVNGGVKSRLVMEDFSSISMGCMIVCATDDYMGSGMINPTIPEHHRADVTTSTIKLEKHTCLGAGTVVFPNVKIREGAVTGAMTMVKSDLEVWGIYVGIPARRVGERESRWILQSAKEMRVFGNFSELESPHICDNPKQCWTCNGKRVAQ